jgi:hypothetical protein
VASVECVECMVAIVALAKCLLCQSRGKVHARLVCSSKVYIASTVRYFSAVVFIAAEVPYLECLGIFGATLMPSVWG